MIRRFTSRSGNQNKQFVSPQFASKPKKIILPLQKKEELHYWLYSYPFSSFKIGCKHNVISATLAANPLLFH